MSSVSTSTEEIHSPPDLMRSLARSVMRTKPCSSSSPMSPVRSQPSSVNLSSPRRVLVVARGDPRPARLDLAGALAQADLGPRHHPALRRAVGPVLLALVDARRRPGHGDDRARLGHPPRLQDAHAVALEALHELARHRRAAADPAAQRAEVAAVLVDVRQQRRRARSARRPPASRARPRRSAPAARPAGTAPGSSSSAPVSAAAKGRPHALTWNIGTMASTRSRDESPTASAVQTVVECSETERCE